MPESPFDSIIDFMYHVYYKREMDLVKSLADEHGNTATVYHYGPDKSDYCVCAVIRWPQAYATNPAVYYKVGSQQDGEETAQRLLSHWRKGEYQWEPSIGFVGKEGWAS